MKFEPQGQRDLLLFVASALNTHRVPYLLSGSFASSYYGYPRATHDIDFVVEVRKDRLELLGKAIEGLGKGFAIIAKELLHVTAPQMVNSYHANTGIRMRISLIAPEDLILTKLAWCKEL